VPPLIAAFGVAGAPVGMALLCLLGALAAWPLAAGLDRDRDDVSPWPTPRRLMAPVAFVARHPVLRSVALTSMVFSIVQLSLTSYLVSYLTGDLRWTLLAAGAALSASQVAGVVGRVVWGVVADRWLGPRRMLMALATAMAGCGLAMPLLGPGSAALPVIALACLFGATAVGWNGVYLATVARLVPHEQAATATAGTLFFTFFGVVVGPPLFGVVGSAFGALGPAFALLALPLGWGLWSLARARWG
jgi:predicted MFS family arabinose efflux permease